MCMLLTESECFAVCTQFVHNANSILNNWLIIIIYVHYVFLMEISHVMLPASSESCLHSVQVFCVPSSSVHVCTVCVNCLLCFLPTCLSHDSCILTLSSVFVLCQLEIILVWQWIVWQ